MNFPSTQAVRTPDPRKVDYAALGSTAKGGPRPRRQWRRVGSRP